MNALLMPFRQLVERKLWPLAILLIAAIAAVPVLLAKDSADAPVGPVAAAGPIGADQAPTQPIVTLGAPADREAARKVLGARKNPFKPAGSASKSGATAKTSTASQTTATGGSSGDAKGGTSGSGGGATTGGSAVGVNPVAPEVKKPTYELFELKIRFGSTESEDLSTRSIKRLTALPRMAEPMLVYLGLKKDLSTAVFLVDANTMIVGDGRCIPSPTNCQNLELKKGQTAFIDVLDGSGQSTAQYQLDFVKVLRKTTSDEDAARKAREVVARGGRKALRANLSRVRGWKYDARSGVLRDEK